jgi:hypothetical protein
MVFSQTRTSCLNTFLLSPAAKTLSLAQVFRMSDAEAEAMFCRVRWFATDGKPVCSHCGGLDAYDCRRPNGSPRFGCRACKKDFTVTAGRLFASHKMPLKSYPNLRKLTSSWRVVLSQRASQIKELGVVEWRF